MLTKTKTLNGIGVSCAFIYFCLALPASAASFHDCEGICPEMAVLPPGSFMMGGKPGEEAWSALEAPRHRVTIPYALAVAVTPITFEQWSACASDGGCNGYTPGDYGFGRGDRPVVAVSWNDAQGYVAWLSAKTGRRYRLLSEAEWEYAARAGTDTAYYWGDAVGSGHAACNGCGSAFDKKSTAPVASFAPNAFGLHDMAGNVMQWTADCWTPNYDGAPADGSARTDGDCSRRVVRGGNWFIRPFALRAGFRRQVPQGMRDDIFGFRVARLR
jgi:formylglycine-generating enzyme required for sulfatase activity